MIARVSAAAAAALALLAFLAVAPARAEPVTVTLLHGNDACEIAPRKGQGGFAPFMTLLQAERARNPNTVTTFGGDLLSPSLLSGLTRGEQMIELANAIGIQVAVPGNHELDFGPRVAAERFAASRFPWLGTSDYLLDGGDGYASLKNGRALIDASAGRLIASTVMNPVTALGGTIGPEVDGRIARLD